MKTLILVVAILFTANVQADIYKYTDTNGKVYYTPDDNNSGSVKIMDTITPDEASRLTANGYMTPASEPKESGLDMVINMAWLLAGLIAGAIGWIYEKISSITFMQIAASVIILQLGLIIRILLLNSYR